MNILFSSVMPGRGTPVTGAGSWSPGPHRQERVQVPATAAGAPRWLWYTAGMESRFKQRETKKFPREAFGRKAMVASLAARLFPSLAGSSQFF